MNQVNVDRVKRFVKHLSHAEKRFQERDIARNNLKKNLYSVKAIVKDKKKQSSINSKLSKIEQSIKELLEKELQLLNAQARDDKLINELKDKISILQTELIKSREEDLQIIMQLKNKISDMNQQLQGVSKKEDDMSDELKAILNSLHAKVESVNKQVLSGKGTEQLRDNILKISDKIQQVKSSDLVSKDLLQEISSFENKLVDIVQKGIIPMSEVNENIKALRSKIDEVLGASKERE